MTLTIKRFIRRGSWLVIAAICLLAPHLRASEVEAPLPLDATSTINLSLDEATWLSLDVAPDGRQLVIEVLGDLYLLDIKGGQAEQLTSGMAFDTQPSYAPDGKTIAFVSDRGGSDDLWVLEGDAEPRKLSATDKRVELASPSWSPDGRHVVVSQSSWTQRTFEVWAYPVDGGAGVQITKALPKSSTPAQQRHNALGAVYDSTGRYLYYARKSGGYGYNISFPTWQIAVKDLLTGIEDIVTRAPGSAIRPALSPDGRWLVYGTRHKQHTGLRIRELQSGDEAWLSYPVQRDEQETRFTRDLLPGYAFTPDSSAVIASRDGGIIRIQLDDKSVSEIPFHVDVDLPVHQRLDFSFRAGVGPVKARVLAEPKLSPDGNQVAIATLGRIYVYDFTKARADAISPREFSAAMPAWSPDGRHIAYAAWREGRGGIYRQRARKGATPEKLTRSNGYYSYPNWTPDGKRIVALHGSADLALQREGGFGQTVGADVVWLSARGGETHVIVPARGFSLPHFGPEPDRVYLYVARTPFPSNGKTGLISVRFDGSDRRDHLSATGMGHYAGGDKGNPENMFMSPGGRHVLLKHASQLYVAQPLPFVQKQTVSLSKSSVPLAKLTDIGADFASWSADGRQIIWSTGDHLYRRSLSSIVFREDDTENKTEDAEKPEAPPENDAPVSAEPAEELLLEETADVTADRIDIYLPRAIPKGTVALTGARLITMSDQGVIEKGTVLIEDHRIVKVGSDDTVELPEDVDVFDMSGHTITPGFIDTHAHFRVSRQLYDHSESSMLANLAYGVTTGMDVQPSTVDMLDAQDRIDAGLMLGPRAFSTGPGVFSNNDFKSKAHALAVLRRYKERYQVNNIKAYISGSRQQRQWLIQAAEELKLMPTTEGALDMKVDVTHMIDGFSGLEHAFPVPRLYDDVVQLAARSGIAYTPTLIVGYGGPWGENYFYTNESPYEDKKLRRFMPYASIARRSLRRPWFHPSEYVTDITAASAQRIVDAGGNVGVGAHGQLQGLGYHWELWLLAAGSSDNLQTLRSATLMGAQMIGLAQDLGSIEPGKLADLNIMTANPIDNIRNTNTLAYVVKNGEIFMTDTLDQIWPVRKPLPDQWWWQDEVDQLVGQ